MCSDRCGKCTTILSAGPNDNCTPVPGLDFFVAHEKMFVATPKLSTWNKVNAPFLAFASLKMLKIE